MPELTDVEIKTLADAYLTESLAAAKNEIFALKGKAEGHPQVERLFTALAKAQRIHAKKTLMLLHGKAASSVENMAESASILDMLSGQYGQALQQLTDENDSAAAGFLDQFKRTAMNHRALVSQMGHKKAHILPCVHCMRVHFYW